MLSFSPFNSRRFHYRHSLPCHHQGGHKLLFEFTTDGSTGQCSGPVDCQIYLPTSGGSITGTCVCVTTKFGTSWLMISPLSSAQCSRGLQFFVKFTFRLPGVPLPALVAVSPSRTAKNWLSSLLLRALQHDRGVQLVVKLTFRLPAFLVPALVAVSLLRGAQVGC